MPEIFGRIAAESGRGKQWLSPQTKTGEFQTDSGARFCSQGRMRKWKEKIME
ncbi:MAG TPA: hypothetical protein VK892_11050 [Pyrinomonadaceae bacterium]|nr:hypothetical protein [Pyrinomonadaceae bacterium]